MREHAPLQVPNHKVVFLESETFDLDKPHDDALVVRLDVGGCELSRIMIDTGSSDDVLFYNAYKQMDFSDDTLCGTRSPLTGFAGETTYSMGTITLLVVACGVQQLTVFEVVDRSAPYNAILGRPWLYNMRAVPSTYHQCVKFPTAEGVKTQLQKQEELAEQRAKWGNDPITRGLRKDLVVPVCIDEKHHDRVVNIASELSSSVRDEHIKFLKENIATFAWSTEDMPGIDLQITSHELNVNLTFKPVKQKRRKLGPDRAKAVNDEVDRLLKVGSIREVKYPDWLANPVVIKKKNGK
ncbi:uncharacterized protein LOC112082819 [Eutrema salsugineum]|uniref:uncharacterized protein LOC112082819 n=1 Tax=Eutrema salsugineum TaxID=72664 RepID=UPI000CECFBD5|nr:uncharacterized protein LOC112082819 [Eutrema salsugineum]